MTPRHITPYHHITPLNVEASDRTGAKSVQAPARPDTDAGAGLARTFAKSGSLPNRLMVPSKSTGTVGGLTHWIIVAVG